MHQLGSHNFDLVGHKDTVRSLKLTGTSLNIFNRHEYKKEHLSCPQDMMGGREFCITGYHSNRVQIALLINGLSNPYNDVNGNSSRHRIIKITQNKNKHYSKVKKTSSSRHYKDLVTTEQLDGYCDPQPAVTQEYAFFFTDSRDLKHHIEEAHVTRLDQSASDRCSPLHIGIRLASLWLTARAVYNPLPQIAQAQCPALDQVSPCPTLSIEGFMQSVHRSPSNAWHRR
jgi:hypothetical protein